MNARLPIQSAIEHNPSPVNVGPFGICILSNVLHSPKFDSRDFPSKNMIGKSDATVSPQDHCFTENILEETGPSLSQDTMKDTVKENTLEMQYSTQYVPLMLHELHSPAAEPEPDISMAIYDMTSE